MSRSETLRPQNATTQLVKLAKTQQFYWFLGHVFALASFLLQTLTSFFRPKSALKYYRFTILSILVTYIIVIKQIHFRKFNLAGVSATKLARDENVQYFLLASTFYLASFIIGTVPGSLHSFIIFAIFHVLTYFQNNLLSIFVPSLNAQQYVNGLINQFTLAYNQQALVLAANSEVMLLALTGFQLIPSLLLELVWSRQIVVFSTKLLVFGAILVFVKLRFDANQYTKAVVDQFDAKINQLVFRVNNPNLAATYKHYRETAIKYLSAIQLPKEDLKKN